MMSSTCVVRTTVVRNPGLGHGLGLVTLWSCLGHGLGVNNLVLFTSVTVVLKIGNYLRDSGIPKCLDPGVFFDPQISGFG